MPLTRERKKDSHLKGNIKNKDKSRFHPPWRSLWKVLLTDVKSCFNSTTLLKSRMAALDLPMAKYTVALL